MLTKQPEYRYLKLWQGIGIFLVVSVIYLSLTPRPPNISLNIEWADKIFHFLAYFTLMAWHSQLYHRPVTKLTLMSAFIAMGVGLEFLQGLGVSRLFEWADAMANSLGAMVAFAISYTRFSFILSRFDKL